MREDIRRIICEAQIINQLFAKRGLRVTVPASRQRTPGTLNGAPRNRPHAARMSTASLPTSPTAPLIADNTPSTNAPWQEPATNRAAYSPALVLGAWSCRAVSASRSANAVISGFIAPRNGLG